MGRLTDDPSSIAHVLDQARYESFGGYLGRTRASLCKRLGKLDLGNQAFRDEQRDTARRTWPRGRAASSADSGICAVTETSDSPPRDLDRPGARVRAARRSSRPSG